MITQAIASGGILCTDSDPSLVASGESSTTSWGTIRDQLVATVQSLTPARHSQVVYRWAPRAGVQYLDLREFEPWAEANDNACFRLFDIMQQAGWQSIGVNAGGTQRRRATFILSIAYPNAFTLYGDDLSGERDDVLEQDIAQISAAIGLHGAANWVTAATPVDEYVEMENGTGVKVARLVVEFEYTY